jgi:DNA (cytosine-5)-methyltransferase 1
MAAYYNEFDPKAAAWLRELVRGGHLPEGEVDARDIRQVVATDLRGFAQHHFFAGIGGWPLALRLAGWPDDRPVWTGSCPCQPFSTAGQRKGRADDRHLWPEFRRLVAECRPPVCFGEQVASRLGRDWLAGVRADLEALGYAVGAADLCAAGVAAPHIRQRLFWVADPDGRQPGDGGLQPGGEHGQQPQDGGTVRLGDPGRTGLEVGGRLRGDDGEERPAAQRAGGEPGRVGDPALPAGERLGHGVGVELRRDPWADAVLIPCRDGKARRTQPGIFPLADGLPGRVGLLRGYGNAIVPQVAAAFVEAYLEARGE